MEWKNPKQRKRFSAPSSTIVKPHGETYPLPDKSPLFDLSPVSDLTTGSNQSFAVSLNSGDSPYFANHTYSDHPLFSSAPQRDSFARSALTDSPAETGWADYLSWDANDSSPAVKTEQSPPDFLPADGSAYGLDFPGAWTNSPAAVQGMNPYLYQNPPASISPLWINNETTTPADYPFPVSGNSENNNTPYDAPATSSTAPTSQSVSGYRDQPSSSQQSPSPPAGSPKSSAGSNGSMAESKEIPVTKTDADSPTSPTLLGPDRKRKSTPEDQIEDSSNPNQRRKMSRKTTHNEIEKRYRTNLNAKITELRDSVPCLRAMSSANGGNAEDDFDLQDGDLTTARKLNKATVLSKATEYIRSLETKSEQLNEENASLKRQLIAFQRFASAELAGANARCSNCHRARQIPTTNAPFDYNSLQAARPVDRSQKPKGRKPVGPMPGQPLQPQTHEQQFGQQQPGAPGNANGGGGYMSKLMVASLAGLTMMEGFNEQQQTGNNPGARGLFAFPIHLFGYFSSSLKMNQVSMVMGMPVFSHWLDLVFLFKMVLVLGALVYVIMPSFFDAKPGTKKGKIANMDSSDADSFLASPLDVRREAWLTSKQTVWVPNHSFIFEIAAIAVKMCKLCLRNVIGWRGYSLLTGFTEEDEAARIKAWDIAIDAQLAGGDADICFSRLLLTFLASATLPDSPTRLMLKALHIHVLARAAQKSPLIKMLPIQSIASRRATQYWNQAREFVHTSNEVSTMDAASVSLLPDFLCSLLQQECNEVLVDSIIQRASNLASGRPTTENTHFGDAGLDSVVEDLAIRSPLDVLAAWWSSLTLRNALVTSIEQSRQSICSDELLSNDINMAVETAPRESRAQLRALAAKAVFLTKDRQENINASVKVIANALREVDDASSLTDSKSMVSVSAGSDGLFTPDVRIAMRCAMTISLIEQSQTRCASTTLDVSKILKSLKQVLDESHIGLLSFAAAYRCIRLCAADDVIFKQTQGEVEQVAAFLRTWIGGEEGRDRGLSKTAIVNSVNNCLDICRKVMGMQSEDINEDQGYWSSSEKDEVV